LYNKGRAELQRRYPERSPHLHAMGAAVGAGAVSNAATNPIWVIRTRLQTQEHVTSKPEYAGTWDAARKMYRREGVTSFYKGMVPNMMGLVHVAIQFPLYEELKSVGLGADDARGGGAKPSALHLVAASSASKLVASTLTYPLEVIRARLHVQRSDGPQLYVSVRGAVARILREEGALGLYSGIQTNLVRVVPACAITFTAYELVLGFLAPRSRGL